MTIVINQLIEDAYRNYVNQPVDFDIVGNPVLRRDTYQYMNNPNYGLVEFAAGFNAAIPQMTGLPPAKDWFKNV